MITRALSASLTLPRIAAWPLVFAGAFVLLVLRRPEALLRAQFFGEDGNVFYLSAWFGGPELLIEPYAGYLIVVPRLIAFAERLVPPPFAPVVGTTIALTVVAALATFLVSDRLSRVVPSRAGRIALAAAALLWPGALDVLGFPTSIGTYLAAYLVALAVAHPATSRAGMAHDATIAVLAALSGPSVVLIAPIFWLRRSWLTWLISGLALIQLGVLLLTPQIPLVVPAAALVWDVLTLRINVAFLGPRLAAPAPEWVAIGLLIAASFILYRTRSPWPWVYAAVVVGGAAVPRIGESLSYWIGADERYFLLAFLAAVTLVIAGLHDRFARPVAMILAAVMVIGALPDVRLQPHPDTNWSQQSRCIGGPEPCRVEVFPGGKWDIQWPGSP